MTTGIGTTQVFHITRATTEIETVTVILVVVVIVEGLMRIIGVLLGRDMMIGGTLVGMMIMAVVVAVVEGVVCSMVSAMTTGVRAVGARGGMGGIGRGSIVGEVWYRSQARLCDLHSHPHSNKSTKESRS